VNKYLLAAITAFIIWGFFSLPLRPLQEYSSISILLFRVVFSIVLLLVYVATRKKFLQEIRRDWLQLPKVAQRKQIGFILLNGSLLSLNWLSFIYTMNHISVRATSLAYLICPILTAFLAIWILKEKLFSWQWISVCISILACFILAYHTPIDALSALFIGLTYAMYLIFQKEIFIKRSTPLLLLQLFIALPIILLYIGMQEADFVVPTETKFYILLLIIAIFFTIIPLLFNIYALKGATSATVGMLLNINPIIAFFLSIFYWKESIDPTQILAFILILLAVLLFNQHYLTSKTRKLFPFKIKKL